MSFRLLYYTDFTSTTVSIECISWLIKVTNNNDERWKHEIRWTSVCHLGFEQETNRRISWIIGTPTAFPCHLLQGTLLSTVDASGTKYSHACFFRRWRCGRTWFPLRCHHYTSIFSHRFFRAFDWNIYSLQHYVQRSTAFQQTSFKHN